MVENQAELLKLKVTNCLLTEEKEKKESKLTRLSQEKDNLVFAVQDNYTHYTKKRAPSTQLAYKAIIIKVGLVAQ